MKRRRRNKEDPVTCDNSTVRKKIWLFKHQVLTFSPIPIHLRDLTYSYNISGSRNRVEMDQEPRSSEVRIN